MGEERVLALVFRHPHPADLGRTARDGTVFAALAALEQRGLVRRRGGLYRLTRRGRNELALAWAVARLLERVQPPATANC